MLPFNIQLKGVIVGMLIAYFLLPMVMGWLGNAKGKGAPA